MASLSSTSVSYRVCHISHCPESWIVVETRPMLKSRTSCTKFMERQVILAWKRVTGAARKPQRASFLPKDFDLVTSRRRSIMLR